MLRKTLVALMMGVICSGSATAGPPSPKGTKPASGGILSWLGGGNSGNPGSSGNATSGKSSNKVAVRPAEQKLSVDAAGGNAQRAATTGSRIPTDPAQTGAGPTESTGPSLLTRFKAKEAAKSTSVERAVVSDTDSRMPAVQRTVSGPNDQTPADVSDAAMAFTEAPKPLTPAITPPPAPPMPLPIEMPPVLPNIDTVSGPQYFSATPATMSNPIPVHPSQNWQQYQAPQPVHLSSQGNYWTPSHSVAPAGPAYSGYAQMSPQTGGGYPQTGASLYPAPVPGIPHQMGGVVIENPAFHPHEMLYAHHYKAMYPPYYYKVNGGWMVTPFGVWSHEDWKLQGTTVDVKYKSHISPLSGFKPPVIR